MDSDEVEHGSGEFSPRYSVLTTVIGSAYALFALAQFIEGAGFSPPMVRFLNVPGDMAAGFVVMVTGILLINGGISSMKKDQNGSGFIIVGFIMGIFLALVHLLVLLSSIATTSLRGDAVVDIQFILGGFVPGLYLSVPLLLLSPPVIRAFRKTARRESKEVKP